MVVLALVSANDGDEKERNIIHTIDRNLVVVVVVAVNAIVDVACCCRWYPTL